MIASDSVFLVFSPDLDLGFRIADFLFKFIVVPVDQIEKVYLKNKNVQTKLITKKKNRSNLGLVSTFECLPLEWSG